MNDPKTFYRELDGLLSQIGKNISGKNLLTSIFIELERTFGEALRIGNSNIYELRGDAFISVDSSTDTHWAKKVNLNTPAIKLVFEHGSFIYDDTRLSSAFVMGNETEYIIPAAIFIHSPEKQWLLVFGLKSGWVREEITLFLNAVQTALNYRMFSDIIGGELQQAVQIQKSLLPRETPDLEGYQIYGQSNPAELVGGDFFEYFNFEESNFGISIGDASGHGLPAALLVRDVVIGLRMGLASEYKLVYTLKKLNKVIQQSTYASNFVSLVMCELENDGHLFYVNAGHPAPFVVHNSITYDLGPTGMVLGFLKDTELSRSHIHLHNKSILVLFTDGIIERENLNDELFGVERLKKLVIENQHLNAKEIVSRIYKTVFEFGDSANWADDATVVVLKRL